MPSASLGATLPGAVPPGEKEERANLGMEVLDLLRDLQDGQHRTEKKIEASMKYAGIAQEQAEAALAEVSARLGSANAILEHVGRRLDTLCSQTGELARAAPSWSCDGPSGEELPPLPDEPPPDHLAKLARRSSEASLGSRQRCEGPGTGDTGDRVLHGALGMDRASTETMFEVEGLAKARALNFFVRGVSAEGMRSSVAKRVQLEGDLVPRRRETMRGIGSYCPAYRHLDFIGGFRSGVAVASFAIGLACNLATTIVYMADARKVDLLSVTCCLESILVGLFYFEHAHLIRSNKRDFLHHCLHLKLEALLFKRRSLFSYGPREALMFAFFLSNVFNLVFVRMAYDFYSEERAWIRMMFLLAVPYSVMQSAFMASGTLYVEFPFRIVRAEMESMENMDNSSMLNHSLELYAEVSWISQKLNKIARDSAIGVGFQFGVGALALLRTLVDPTVPCPLWLVCNTLCTAGCVSVWMIAVAWTNACYERLNARCAQKRYTVAEAVQDSSCSSEWRRQWSLAVRLESIQSLDKSVAKLLGVPIKPQHICIIGGKVCIGAFLLVQYFIASGHDVRSRFSFSFLTFG